MLKMAPRLGCQVCVVGDEPDVDYVDANVLLPAEIQFFFLFIFRKMTRVT